MRALVTGSTGFVGSSLVAALNQRGIEVRGLRRENSPEEAIEGLKLTFAVGDILDPASLPRAMEDVDWVFHVAAVSDHRKTKPDVIYKVNVEGARNVFEAAKQVGVKRVVFTSSSAALGIPREGKPLLNETDRFNMHPEEFPYGHSKQLADDVMQEYVQQGLDAVSVLPAGIMGPRDLKFISGELIAQALKGIPVPVIPKGGVNYIDVRDCVEGQIAAAEKGRCGERYLLAGHNLTHRQMMETMRAVLGTKVPPIDIPRAMLPGLAVLVSLLQKMGADLPINREALMMGGQYLFYDNAKAVQELGLKTRPVSESIRDSYLWYEANGFLQKRGIPTAPKAVSPAS